MSKKILSDLGIVDYKEYKNEFLCNCIFCNDFKYNLQFNFMKGVYHCWVCNEKGRIETLVSEIKGVSKSEAKRILEADEIDVNVEVEFILDQLKEIEQSDHKYEYDIYLRKERFDYWLERGIKKKAVKKFKLGWDKFNDRLVIPVLQYGQCVALIKRARQKKGQKYLNSKGFKRDFCLYPFDQININKKYIMVCEGPIDAINLHQLGFNAISVLGAYISKYQVRFLTNNFENIILAMDNDKAGRMAVRNLKVILGDYCNVFRLVYNNSDPGNIKHIDEIERIQKLI